MQLIKGILENPTRLQSRIVYNMEIEENANVQADEGVLVDEIISFPAPKKGKSYIHYVNPQTAQQWYEEVDRPLTQEELLEIQSEKIDLLLQMQMAAQNII